MKNHWTIWRNISKEKGGMVKILPKLVKIGIAAKAQDICVRWQQWWLFLMFIRILQRTIGVTNSPPFIRHHLTTMSGVYKTNYCLDRRIKQFYVLMSEVARACLPRVNINCFYHCSHNSSIAASFMKAMRTLICIMGTGRAAGIWDQAVCTACISPHG